jgi:hypothetical protein
MNIVAPMSRIASITTAQIGKCGELLVQYRLLKHSVESSPMATDTGIDLIAYSAVTRQAVSIQVKTNLRAKPGGGKGPLALDWWVPQQSPADYFALVDLESDRVWLFTAPELDRFAQQKPEGRLHFYFYTDASAQPRGEGKRAKDFEEYMLERRVADLFGAPI